PAKRIRTKSKRSTASLLILIMLTITRLSASKNSGGRDGLRAVPFFLLLELKISRDGTEAVPPEGMGAFLGRRLVVPSLHRSQISENFDFKEYVIGASTSLHHLDLISSRHAIEPLRKRRWRKLDLKEWKQGVGFFRRFVSDASRPASLANRGRKNSLYSACI